MRVRSVVVAWLLLLAATIPAAAPATSPGAAAVVYLVRHAEKVDPYPEDPGDPPLTEAGWERGRALARALADAGITRILSSDFRRTRDTAAPLAGTLGLEVDLYDPEALEELARRLSTAGERVLVVGHSNTTPRLVELLGGQPGPPIDEADEYDRLYVLALSAGGEPATIRIRYGDPPATDAGPARREELDGE